LTVQISICRSRLHAKNISVGKNVAKQPQYLLGENSNHSPNIRYLSGS
jgi:hypothetical protein